MNPFKIFMVRLSLVLFLVLNLSLGVSLSSCTRDSASSTIKVAGGRVGQFKGQMAVTKILVARLFQHSEIGFGFSSYLGFNDSLIEIMGGYSEIGPANDFRNGTPNALNMLLWQMVISGMSEDLASSCGSPSLLARGSSSYKFNESFAGRLNALCAWPNPEVKNETNFLNLWWAVQGFDAPREEFEAWRDFFLSSSSPYANATHKEALTAMFKTMLLSPYFLLEH